MGRRVLGIVHQSRRVGEQAQAGVKKLYRPLLAHVCAFSGSRVRNPLKMRGRFSIFEDL